MMAAERVEVPMSERQIACVKHLAPFRLDWPRGWAEFAIMVSQAALDSPMLQTGLTDPRYWEYEALFWSVNQDEGWRNITLLPETRASVTRIRQMLFDRPACEWARPGTLFAAYIASGIGEMGQCRVCRQLAEGAPYPVTSGQTFAVVDHVCFKCTVMKKVG